MPVVLVNVANFTALSSSHAATLGLLAVVVAAGWQVARRLYADRHALGEAEFDIEELNAVIVTLQQRLLAPIDDAKRAAANTGNDCADDAAKVIPTFEQLTDLPVANLVGDGLLLCEGDTTIVSANIAAQKMFGALEGELRGSRLAAISRLLDEPSRQPIEGMIERCLTEQATLKLPPAAIIVLRKSNVEFDVTGTLTPLATTKANNNLCLVHLCDVSGQRDAERMAHFYATHDAFTGLPGIRELYSAIALRRSMAGSHGVAVVDLDRFEAVVDNFGYDVASMFARKAASALQATSSTRDTVFGLGHDVFAVLWTRDNDTDGGAVGESLRRAVEALRVRVGGLHQSVSASVGISSMVSPLDPGAVLAHATVARTAARQAGGNRVYQYAEDDPRIIELSTSVEWTSEVRKAIAADRLRMYLQPIQALNPNMPERAELLLRLVDEAGEVWAPDHFMAAAERHNLMPEIDRWVVNWVVNALVESHPALREFGCCALNVSAQSLTHESFRDFVLQRLRRNADVVPQLCIEVTESTYLGELRELEPFFYELRSLGCSLAIDDFGAGFSSYGYLKNRPADTVKIDGSFVTEMMRDPVDRAMVDSINRLAHRLGMRTVAEFVGDAETLESLRTMGVDYAQGVHVGAAREIGIS
jgi:diguanylate cyclase (GGDEF)-like protein